jgi:YD repeat-containing protein
VGTETTRYDYFPTGLLKEVTLPDSSTISYAYDAAHRLTDITDTLGNRLHNTLDNAGNKTGETFYDSSNNVQSAHSSVFNALSQRYQDITSAGTAAVTTTYGYDAQGNPLNAAAPLARTTGNLYDALNRVSLVSDPKGGITKLGYDARDNPASVKDPRGLVTSYAYDGFDEITSLSSPDTGSSTYSYNSAGLIHLITDARGITSSWGFDALGRLTQNGFPDQTITYTYDTGTNGIGHLTGAHDASHTMAWSYDALGRVTGKSISMGFPGFS